MIGFPDTNVLMQDAKSIFDTYDEVIICDIVLGELDDLKESDNPKKAWKARVAIRCIESNESKTKFIRCYTNDKEMSNDDKIIELAKSRYNKDTNAFELISNDYLFRLKCNLYGLPCEKFEKCEANIYTGYRNIYANESDLAEWYESERIDKWGLLQNEYAFIWYNDEIIDMAKKTEGKLIPLSYKPIVNSYCGKINPRNDKQKLAFDMLQDENTHYKCLTGCFGSGKDFLMINTALQLLQSGKYRKIVWVVQNYQVKNTKDIGTLPGDIVQKLYPFTNILADKIGGQESLLDFIDRGQVEIVPLAFMRGRSFDESILMLSEAENTTKEHIQLVMGRMGEGSMFMINGDFKQVDNDMFRIDSGLSCFIDRLKGHKEFGHVMFDKTERSELSGMSGLLD